jgi:Glycosyl hydrolases family 43
VASAEEPGGPFVDGSDGPLVCQLDQGGSIDPSPIAVDGEVFLLWKNDGNCCGLPTRIYSARLTADGLRLASAPVPLVRNDRAWEDRVVEAPSMVQVGERFLLLYAGNEWNSAEYATGYAWCDTVSGPCHKGNDAPLLSTNDERAGPGGAHVFAGPAGRLHIVYHAWTGGRVGYDTGGVRALFVEPLTIVDGTPRTSSSRAP